MARKRKYGGRWCKVDDPYYLPDEPGCYVVYVDGALTYVGQSTSLYARFNYGGGHRCELWRYSNTWKKTPWGPCRKLVIKYRPSVKFGDWAMVELRLIRRLQPPGNCRGSTKKVQRREGACPR